MYKLRLEDPVLGFQVACKGGGTKGLTTLVIIHRPCVPRLSRGKAPILTGIQPGQPPNPDLTRNTDHALCLDCLSTQSGAFQKVDQDVDSPLKQVRVPWRNIASVCVKQSKEHPNKLLIDPNSHLHFVRLCPKMSDVAILWPLHLPGCWIVLARAGYPGSLLAWHWKCNQSYRWHGRRALRDFRTPWLARSCFAHCYSTQSKGDTSCNPMYQMPCVGQ